MRWGIVALLGVSAAAIVVADAINPEVDPAGEMVSRYVNFTAGWLITVALLGIGVASAGVTWLVRAGAGRIALGCWAVGVLVAGVFPADPPGQWDRASTSDMVHGAAAWTAFAVFPVAAVLLGRTRALRWLAVVSAVTTVVFAVFMIDVMDGPSMAGIGAVERALILVNLVWLAIAAVRGERGRNDDRSGRADPAGAAVR